MSYDESRWIDCDLCDGSGEGTDYDNGLCAKCDGDGGYTSEAFADAAEDAAVRAGEDDQLTDTEREALKLLGWKGTKL